MNGDAGTALSGSPLLPIPRFCFSSLLIVAKTEEFSGHIKGEGYVPLSTEKKGGIIGKEEHGGAGPRRSGHRGM